MSELGPMRLIVNPKAGNGSVRRTLPELLDALERRDADFDVVQTRGKRDAAGVARQALQEGIRYLVAVGGDGTVHEVVNGMFEDRVPLAADAVLGVFAAGSGCDFVRTFGLDRAADVVADHLCGPHTMPIDVGVARFVDDRGADQEELFVNVAEIGYGAEVLRVARRFPRRLGRLRYLFGAWAAIRAVERQETDVVVAHTRRAMPVVELVAANGQFFGGGMKVAPRALPDDGRFNVLVFTGQRSQVFALTTKLFQGEHLPHPDIAEYQSPTVELGPERPMLVEADGELLGRTPASFSLLPRALTVKI